MPLILPGNVGSATAATGYDVANSLRFNNGSSDRLTRTTTGSVTNADKVTFSAWVKRSGQINQNISIWGEYYDTNNRTEIGFNSTNDHFYIYGKDGGSTYVQVETNATFRDVSAWYHFVLAYDSTDGTAANRVKMYVNGVQITSFATATYPNQNTDIRLNSTNQGYSVGDAEAADHFWDGYMCEVAHVDGQQLAPTAFGEFDDDSGIWKPKDFKDDTTFGTNGYYLEFKQSGVGTNASGMGADTSGNDNHFAVNNLTAIDQSTDTCTNNFATLNPLDNVVSQAVFTEGNLKSTMNNSNSQGVGSTGTFWVSSGKWYVEAKLINNAGDNGSAFGVTGKVGLSTASADRVGNSADAITYTDTGQKAIAGSYTNSYGSSFTNGDIIGIYIDLDNLKIYFAKNGSLQNSGTGLTLNAIANTLNGVYTFSVGMNAGTGTPVFEINFGGTQTYSISSAVTDDNGYGNFEYSPNITGDSVAKKFYSMCTKNLAEYG